MNVIFEQGYHSIKCDGGIHHMYRKDFLLLSCVCDCKTQNINVTLSLAEILTALDLTYDEIGRDRGQYKYRVLSSLSEKLQDVVNKIKENAA